MAEYDIVALAMVFVLVVLVLICLVMLWAIKRSPHPERARFSISADVAERLRVLEEQVGLTREEILNEALDLYETASEVTLEEGRLVGYVDGRSNFVPIGISWKKH